MKITLWCHGHLTSPTAARGAGNNQVNGTPGTPSSDRVLWWQPPRPSTNMKIHQSLFITLMVNTKNSAWPNWPTSLFYLQLISSDWGGKPAMSCKLCRTCATSCHLNSTITTLTAPTLPEASKAVNLIWLYLILVFVFSRNKTCKSSIICSILCQAYNVTIHKTCKSAVWCYWQILFVSFCYIFILKVYSDIHKSISWCIHFVTETYGLLW